MDLSLWEDDCVFADPFSSFGGPGSLARFQKNAANLGKFVINPKIVITNFSVDENVVTVGWIFSSLLKLPWQPTLAARGETKHILKEGTNRIVRYEERWVTDPWEVIRRLFLPSPAA